MSKKIKNLAVMVALVAFISVTLSSCHKTGCPNQITKADIELDESC